MQPLVLTPGTIALLLFLLLLYVVYIQGYKRGKKDQKKQDSKPKKDGYSTIILPASILKKGRKVSGDEISFVREVLIKISNFPFSKEKKYSIKEAFSEGEVILN